MFALISGELWQNADDTCSTRAIHYSQMKYVATPIYTLRRDRHLSVLVYGSSTFKERIARTLLLTPVNLTRAPLKFTFEQSAIFESLLTSQEINITRSRTLRNTAETLRRVLG